MKKYEIEMECVVKTIQTIEADDEHEALDVFLHELQKSKYLDYSPKNAMIECVDEDI